MEDPTAGNPGAGQGTGSNAQGEGSPLHAQTSALEKLVAHFRRKESSPQTDSPQQLPSDNSAQFAENLGFDSSAATAEPATPPMASSLEQPVSPPTTGVAEASVDSSVGGENDFSSLPQSPQLETPAAPAASDAVSPSIQPDLTQAPSGQVLEPSILDNSAGISQGVVGEQPKEEGSLSKVEVATQVQKMREATQNLQDSLKELDKLLGTNLSGEQQPAAPTASPNPEPVEATP